MIASMEKTRPTQLDTMIEQARKQSDARISAKLAVVRNKLREERLRLSAQLHSRVEPTD